ncbi:MAG: GNAT family N-acetyltransferase [Erysipelotrichaceae bacterium]|nr:GNAT family N-acetyltransferase [Erysipelotrichaceae bacterium]
MIRLAEKDDLIRLKSFYDDVIDYQRYDSCGAAWTKDVYPSVNDLKRHLENDLFYILEEREKIAGAACISLHEEENYRNAPWSLNLKEEEIAVLHLMAIHPSRRGKGLSKELLSFIIENISGKVKAIHLDVIEGNNRAAELYEKAGFRSVGLYRVFYEDTGNIMVDLMEYIY